MLSYTQIMGAQVASCMPVVEVHHLKKKYGNITAVNDVSFEVDKGEIFGYMGPNGSGKTTTIKVLTTLTPPSSGDIHILGFQVGSEDEKVRKRIGVVMQTESYESNSTVEGSLDLYGLLWNIPRRDRSERIENLLNVFGLASLRKRHVTELSMGLRRRLQVAREFMHDPDILFLDEPTVGLDTLSRMALLDMIRSYAKAGVTILLTTHFLSEADYLCDRMALIDSGDIVWGGRPKEFKDNFGGLRTIEIEAKGPNLGEFIKALRMMDTIAFVAPSDHGEPIKVLVRETTNVLDTILKLAESAGVTLGMVTIQQPTLEQAFVNFMKAKGGSN